MVQFVADGLQVALLGQPGQEGPHAAVELEFTVKLGRERAGMGGRCVMEGSARGGRAFYTHACTHAHSVWSRRSIKG